MKLELESNAIAVLRELVELKAIKRKIEARTATDDERERYKFSKEQAWLTAEGLLHDAPVANARPINEAGESFEGQVEMLERIDQLERDLLRIMWELGEKSEEVGMHCLAGLHEECRVYAHEYGTSRGIPKPLVQAIAGAFPVPGRKS